MGCGGSKADANPASSDEAPNSPKTSSPNKLWSSPDKSPASGSSNPGSPLLTKGIASRSDSLQDVYVLEAAKLGEGRFGTVAKGTHKQTNESVAIKTIPVKKTGDVDAISSELNIMKQVAHSSIVKLIESFQDSSNVFLVMELCQGGTLLQRVLECGHLTELDTAKVMLQILPALQCLHDLMICHRDIKPENFVFRDSLPIDQAPQGFVKMCDFGGACYVRHGEYLTAAAGTPIYVAPEVLQGKYNETCDLWSTGVILFVLLSGIPPFIGETDEEILSQARLGNISLNAPIWSTISEGPKDLLRELCKRQAKDRISAEEAVDHDWLIAHKEFANVAGI